MPQAKLITFYLLLGKFKSKIHRAWQQFPLLKIRDMHEHLQYLDALCFASPCRCAISSNSLHLPQYLISFIAKHEK